MACQDVGLKAQPVFKGTYESTKAHNIWFIPRAIWLWDRERRQKQAGFPEGHSLYFTQSFYIPSFATRDLPPSNCWQNFGRVPHSFSSGRHGFVYGITGLGFGIMGEEFSEVSQSGERTSLQGQDIPRLENTWETLLTLNQEKKKQLRINISCLTILPSKKKGENSHRKQWLQKRITVEQLLRSLENSQYQPNYWSTSVSSPVHFVIFLHAQEIIWLGLTWPTVLAVPQGCSLPFIHAGEQRKWKLWALLQNQKQLPSSTGPWTASNSCFKS